MKLKKFSFKTVTSTNDIAIKKIKSESPVLKKSKSGVHFYESDPFWVERIAEEGYTWQIQSE